MRPFPIPSASLRRPQHRFVWTLNICHCCSYFYLDIFDKCRQSTTGCPQKKVLLRFLSLQEKPYTLTLQKTKMFSSPDFQNYLRTQTGNNTTVNIIISTVDYLLRVQARQTASTTLNTSFLTVSLCPSVIWLKIGRKCMFAL